MVICLGWYSRAKKKFRPKFRPRKLTHPYRPHPLYRPRKGRRYGMKPSRRYRDYSPAYRYYKSPTRRKYARKMKRFNRRHQVVGLTPDYWLSPIDAIPGGVYYSKTKKGVKGARYARRKSKAAVEVVKAGYRSRRRGRSMSSRKGRRRRRGTYYYYRGKRIYRK